jgi:DNA-binding IclR family transcriptional regulator
MKKSALEKVMEATRAIMHTRTSLTAYGPEIVKKSGLSSSAVYGALSELTIHKMLEHRYHGGPYYLTSLSYGPADQRAFEKVMADPSSNGQSAPHGGDAS